MYFPINAFSLSSKIQWLLLVASEDQYPDVSSDRHNPHA